MASPGNQQHCANCIGTLSFRMTLTPPSVVFLLGAGRSAWCDGC